VVVAALPEQPVVDDVVDIELIQEWVTVLTRKNQPKGNKNTRTVAHTFDTDAVNTTTS